MKPQKVSDIDIAFPASVKGLLPAWSDIPEEFKSTNHPWCREVSRIFYSGGSVQNWKEKDGINKDEAIRHFKAVIGSFEPKHEHKEAGLAYLLSQWFTLEQQP